MRTLTLDGRRDSMAVVAGLAYAGSSAINAHGGCFGSFWRSKHRGRLPRADAPVAFFYFVALRCSSNIALANAQYYGRAMIRRLRETVSPALPHTRNIDNKIAKITAATGFGPTARDTSCEPADRMLEFSDG